MKLVWLELEIVGELCDVEYEKLFGAESGVTSELTHLSGSTRNYYEWDLLL